MSETKEKAGKLKVKAKVLKPKQLSKSDKPLKVDLSKPKTEEKDAIQVTETKTVDVDQQAGDGGEVGKRGTDESSIDVKEEQVESAEEKPVIEEVIEEPEKEEEVVEIGEKMETPMKKESEPQEPVLNLPDNIEKLVEFMKETGGTIDDYVRLNADYSQVDQDTLLREYYKQTKSHLNTEEINFLIEDNFSWDEDVDEERVIKKTKLAYKEEVAKAQEHLKKLKDDYYKEIKLRPGVTQEQQKAMDFFNRYNEEQNVAQQQHDDFKSNTKKYFTDEFKGFDFEVGEKKFRYGVKNVNEVADKQSNISNTIKKFLSETGDVKDVKGYHKAIYAAENADSIAQHFYEQGKADAVRDISAKANNVQSEPRSVSPTDLKVGGYRIKSVSGLDSSKLKIKKSFN
jgi:hypothetical protein